MPWPRSIVDRNDRLSRLRIRIKRSPPALDDIGSGGSGGGEGGTIVEDGIAVIVLAGGDVEGWPGVRHHERAQPDSFGQRERAAQKQAIPGIKCGAAVIRRKIIRIGREGTDPRRVAVGKIQGVKAEQRKPRAQAKIHIRDELVLIEESIRLILIKVPFIGIGPCAGGRRTGGIGA